MITKLYACCCRPLEKVKFATCMVTQAKWCENYMCVLSHGVTAYDFGLKQFLMALILYI